jgi:ATP synthase I chain
MLKLTADRMIAAIAAFGVAATIAGFMLGGGSSAFSAALGAAIGLVNFIFLRSIVSRVVGRAIETTGPFVGLLFLKMGGLMAIVFIVLAQRWVEPIAFVLGLSALVAGLLTASFLSFGHAPKTEA